MFFKSKKPTIDPYKDLNYLKERREVYNSKIAKGLGVKFNMNALLKEGSEGDFKPQPEMNLEGEDRYIVRIPSQSHDEFHDDMVEDFARGTGSDVYSAFQEARKEASPGAKIYQVYDTVQDRSATGRFSSFGNRYNELDWYDEEQDLNWEDGDEFGLGGDYYDAKPSGGVY